MSEGRKSFSASTSGISKPEIERAKIRLVIDCTNVVFLE